MCVSRFWNVPSNCFLPIQWSFQHELMSLLWFSLETQNEYGIIIFFCQFSCCWQYDDVCLLVFPLHFFLSFAYMCNINKTFHLRLSGVALPNSYTNTLTFKIFSSSQSIQILNKFSSSTKQITQYCTVEEKGKQNKTRQKNIFFLYSLLMHWTRSATL